jgi:signal peptidase I
MLTTIVFATLFIGLIVASLVLWAVLLWLGLRWAKVADVTTRRVVLATTAAVVLNATIDVLFALVSPSSDALFIALVVAQLAAAVIVPCLVIAKVFKTRFLRAVQAWLPTLLAPVLPVAFAIFVLRPLLYEAFVVPTNAMAPTLIGYHWQGVCPECGRPNYCSPLDERFGPSDPPQMICDNFHVIQPSDVDRRTHTADRFFAAKFLTPRRWDLVVFQYPGEPSTLYVKRLVGLPGERIHIDDGAVWVNGKKQAPPDAIRGLVYLSELWGSVRRPAVLGDDEYFMLGDFSAQSKDSRLWERGAPGHNPFAVPESHLKGVVTHTYWPPDRWRIHR